MSLKLLYFCQSSYGGLADYAHEQANTLVHSGVEVTLLCPPSFVQERKVQYKLLPLLAEAPTKTNLPKVFRLLRLAMLQLHHFNTLAQVITQGDFKHVLLGTYVEYLAPLWSRQLQKLAQTGVIFGALVHDPVRDFVVGPRWWHRWSIACGYTFLRESFVHAPVELDTVRPMPQLQTTVIPHGPYHFCAPTQSSLVTRQGLDIPPCVRVMLAFGHLRDNKNLDLVLRAMVSCPAVYLVVAGKESYSGQRSARFYQQLAQELGVADRCRWLTHYIAQEEAANLFTLADLVLVTYAASFHSASGVLNAAIGYRRPCLASAGDGALKVVVHNYHLGVWVEPGSVSALEAGLDKWLTDPPTPQWEQYLLENCWSRNAKLVIQRFSAYGGRDHDQKISFDIRAGAELEQCRFDPTYQVATGTDLSQFPDGDD